MLLKYLLAVAAVYGQSAWLVKDVPAANPASSNPQGAVRMGNAIYTMTSSTPRPTLWKYDLATRRSSLVKEFQNTGVSSDSSLAVVNNRLIFTAQDLNNVGGLWTSDGTASGTAWLSNAYMSWSDIYSPFVVSGGYLYANGSDGVSNGLWRTDGTAAGTGPVAPAMNAYVNHVVQMGGQIYFAVHHNNDGTRRLWRTDGTAAGTSEVAGPAQGLTDIAWLRAFGTKLLFTGRTAGAGYELWASDGTTAGTSLVADIEPGTNSSYPTMLQANNGAYYFSAFTSATGWELWKTDATAAGTVLVKELSPGSGSSGFYSNAVAVANGYLFAVAYINNVGTALVRTDGTTAGTISVATGVYESLVAKEDGTGVYFDFSGELGMSDGTVAGTVLVKDICGPTCSSSPRFLRASSPGKNYFRAFTPATGLEFFVTDGTAVGTLLAADLNTADEGARPRAMVALGGFHYYTTTDSQRMVSLWRTDGTSAGTTVVKTLYEGDQPSQLHVVNGRLVFLARVYQNPQAQLWASDGTAGGTSMIQSHAIYYSGGVVSGNKLFYGAHAASGQIQLWTSDGTAAGTTSSSGAVPNPALEGTRVAVLPGGRIVFGGILGNLLWVSDGTAAGTSSWPVSGSPDNFVTDGSRVFFRLNNTLWKTDGTAAGTVQVSNLSGINGPWFALGGAVFFGYSSTLMKSDGTAVGTAPFVPSLSPQIYPIDYRYTFGELAGRVYFGGSSIAGSGLWSTDGTAAGTVLVASVNPGYTLYQSSGSHLYFTACDNSTGCEPWLTDGTAVGTKRVADIAPGVGGPYSYPNNSNPIMLAAAPGGRMYMSASHPLRGHELWLADPVSCAVPADVTAQMTVTAGVPVFNRNSGRFVQNVSIRNNGGAVDGVAYVVSGLNPAATVLNSHGVTHCFAPVGAPYRDIGAIGAGQTVTVTLEFTAAAGTPLTYTPKVISAVDGPR